MSSFQNKLSFKKKKPSELNNVAVTASKGLGKVWRFNIYFPLLVGIVVVIVLNFLFSFVWVAHYLSEQQQKSFRVQLEKDLKETKRALYQARQRLQFLKNYIDPTKIPVENGVRTGSDKTSLKTSEADARKAIVSIEGLKTNRRDANLSVTFKLTRSKSALSPIRGYVFVIAVDNGADPPRMYPSPTAVFKDGFPIDPKKRSGLQNKKFSSASRPNGLLRPLKKCLRNSRYWSMTGQDVFF